MSNFNTRTNSRMEVEIFGRIRCAYSFASIEMLGKGVSWESQIAQNYLKEVERFVTSSDYANYEAIEKWCGNWLFVIDEI